MHENKIQIQGQSQGKIWLMILLCALCAAFNNYVHNDFTVLSSSYQDLLQDKIQNFEDYYGQIYSFSLFFSILTAGLIGQSCNLMGVTLTLMVMQTISLLSQFLVYYGILKVNPDFIMIGKIIFNSIVTQNGLANGIFITQMFEKDKISFPIAIQAMTGTVFNGLNSYFSPEINNQYGLLTNNFFLSILSVFSLILVSIIVILQLNMEEEQEKFKVAQQTISPDNQQNQIISNNKINDQKQQIAKKNNENEIESSHHKQTNFFPILIDILSNPSFISLTVIITSFFIYTTIVNIIGVNFMQEIYGFSQQQAGKIMSLTNLMTLSLPLFGKLIDYTNERTISYLQYAGYLSILASSLILIQNPVIGCVIYGISNSVRILLFFPNVEKILPSKQYRNVGISFIKAFENLLASVIIFENGRIFDIFQSYKGMMYFCCGFTIIGTILAIFLNQSFYNQKNERSKEMELSEKQQTKPIIINNNNQQ